MEEQNHQPDPKDDHRKAGHAGGTTPAGNQATTRRPRPAAKAAEPHEPDPRPWKERPGRTPAGHAPEGTTTSNPRRPGATERTQAADRNTKAATAPPALNRGAEARKTNNEEEPEKKERTAASTPRAQPTDTRQPDRGTAGKTEANADIAARDGERDPEKPREDTPRSKPESTHKREEAKAETAAAAEDDDPGKRTRKRPHRTKRGRKARRTEARGRHGTETRKRRTTRRTAQNDPGPKKAEAAALAKARATDKEGKEHTQTQPEKDRTDRRTAQTPKPGKEAAKATTDREPGAGMKAEGEAEGENIAKNQPNNNSIAWARAKSKHKKINICAVQAKRSTDQEERKREATPDATQTTRKHTTLAATQTSRQNTTQSGDGG